MRIPILACTALLCASTSIAQLTTSPDGGNKKAMVGEQIGITDVTIHYDRPAVKGRDGQIWGGLVHKGFADLGFGTSKSAPWRAGANENTVIEFSTDVKVEGQNLPAGKYALFIAYDPNESTVIFSKNYTSWGSFFYDPKEDALRVTVKPVPSDKKVEWLQYQFTNETETGATLELSWEKLIIPIHIETDYVNLQIASFRKELRGEKSFNPGWQSFNQAANFCLMHNTNLEEALTWADHSINGAFIGEKNFRNLSTKAQLLSKLNKQDEAKAIMKDALTLGTPAEVHNYARQLLAQKKNQEAFDVFKLNYDKHPNTFTTNMGLTRGYSALGNYKKALEYANKALPQSPDNGNKINVERLIKMLNEGKDVN
ncbi:DUF2911 domain-containing protein [Pseudobacter ginsenosidimutans]|uniref:DUF2911 family protein n=1 Tax=Pseudobacter ginsenosidimutans TaxID=661488 RepID=A0A4Q7MZW4_9BACT|nr:DUF2911 domain-containing protein [Pseudobacter ginsenosidimutans]QEC43454.1 DUF2911 domain-containing protein [Pseudobacter ginsenosidimutans]RZS74840.1 DUF2911 family protein [Pseudobacter ginsenosidimutans]